jgi:hypothetical protein
MVEIYLGGYLNYFDRGKRSHFTLAISPKMGLIEILELLEVPSAEIAFASVNGELMNVEITSVGPDDRIEFYPPMGGG